MTKFHPDFYFPERESLDDFDIDREDCLFRAIYREIVKFEHLIDVNNTEWSICQILNDACYITAFALHEKRPICSIGELRKYAEGWRPRNIEPYGKTRGDVVMIVTWLLLRKVKDKSADAVDFYNLIETDLFSRPKSKENLEFFLHACPEKLNQDVFDFSLPVMTKDFVKQFVWRGMTSGYQSEEVKKAVLNLRASTKERMIILEAIRDEVKEDNQLIIDKKPLFKLLNDLEKELNVFQQKEKNADGRKDQVVVVSDENGEKKWKIAPSRKKEQSYKHIIKRLCNRVSALEDQQQLSDIKLSISPRKETSFVLILDVMYYAGWFDVEDGGKLPDRNKTLKYIMSQAFGKDSNVQQILQSPKSRNEGKENWRMAYLDEIIQAFKDYDNLKSSWKHNRKFK